MLTIPGSSRYEIKQVTHEIHLPDVRSWLRLHPAAFSVAYPRRQVNNIYFDTPQLRSLEENFAGVALRQKVRLRWYGKRDADVQAVFEIKRKRNMLGWKISEPLPGMMSIGDEGWDRLVAALRAQLSDGL